MKALRNGLRNRMRIAIISTMILSAMAAPSSAADARRTATLMAVQGSVEIRPAVGEWVPGRAKTKLVEGDFIKTGKDSWALVSINGAAEVATVELREKSNMELSALPGDAKTGATTLLDLYAGEIMVKAKSADREKSKLEVKTPTSVVVVQGGKTSFSVKVEQLAE